MPPRRRRSSNNNNSIGVTKEGESTGNSATDATDDTKSNTTSSSSSSTTSLEENSKKDNDTNSNTNSNTAGSSNDDSNLRENGKADTSTGSSEEQLDDQGGNGDDSKAPLTREQLEESQSEIKREHEQLYLKYRDERQRLINKEIELTEAEKHPKIEKEIEALHEDRQKRLTRSERQFDYTVATITEQYESKRQQIDNDYNSALTELTEEGLERRRRMHGPERGVHKKMKRDDDDGERERDHVKSDRPDVSSPPPEPANEDKSTMS